MKKDMKKIIAPVGMVAFALVCVFGGMAWTAHVDAAEQARIQAELKARDEQLAMESQKAAEEVPAPSFQLAIPAPTPKPTATVSEPDTTPVGETVTVNEDGTVVITPDFAHQKDGAIKIQTPEAQVTANMGGSGGADLPIGEDGAYHGDNPATPRPAEPPVPVASQMPQKPQTTPMPVVDTPPAATPSPEPAGDQGGGSGDVPNYTGKNGEIKDNYMWCDGFGWVEMGGSDGSTGSGGYIDDSDRGWAPGEMGETVGSM